MSHYSYNPFLHGTEKDSSRGPPHSGRESYPSGLGHPSGSVGGLLASLAHHSMSSPGQSRTATNDNLQRPFDLLVSGERQDVRLPVQQMCHSTDQVTYRNEFLSFNKGTTSYTQFFGHSEIQTKSVNAGYFGGGENVRPFRAAEEYNQSIPGLGDDDHQKPTPGVPPASSQPKYTFEAASNILQQFGLEMDDLEPLLSFPEDQVTPANLPFILRKIRTCKESATSSTGQSKPCFEASIEKAFVEAESWRENTCKDKKPLVHNQSNKIIDYGHSSKYDGSTVDDMGRLIDSGTDSKESKHKEDGCYRQGLQKEGKGDKTKRCPNLSNPYSQHAPYDDNRKCLPNMDHKKYDFRPSTSETFKHIPSSSHPKPPTQKKPSESLSRTFHPRRPDLVTIENKSSKSTTSSPNMGSAVSELTKTQANQKTGMLVIQGRQPNPTQPKPPLMQTAQNLYKPAGPPGFYSHSQSAMNPQFISESTFKGTAIPRLITSNMQGATISAINKVPSCKDTVYKSLPTTAMMHDYAATTPRVFPHTCSLCYKEFAQMKEWATHQNSALHLENCKLLRKQYPQWDGSLTRALSDERKNYKPNTTTKRSHGSRTVPKRQSPHRRGIREQGKEKQGSRSPSRSPLASRYTRKRSHEDRNTPTKRHGSSSPRRSKEKWYSASRHYGSSSPRRSQERQYSPARRHGSLSPRRIQEKQYSPAKRPENISPKRQAKRSPTERGTFQRLSPGESKEDFLSLKSSKERQLPSLMGASKRLPPLKGVRKDVSQRRGKEKSSTFESHEPNKSLKPNKTPAQGMKKTAEKLAKSVLESSVLQSLPRQCDVEAVVKTLTPVILAEWGKIMVSSSAPPKSKKVGLSSTATSSSVSAAKKKPLKKKPATLEAGKNTPPTMVKLCGIQPCISHNDVLLAVEHYGRTKSVLLIRSRREAVVCFEKEEDARKVKTLEIKGCTVTPKPKETLKKEQKKPLSKKPAVPKPSSLKNAKSTTPASRKVPSSVLMKQRVKHLRKCPADAARVNPSVTKAKQASTGRTVFRKTAKIGKKRRLVKLIISVGNSEQTTAPEEPGIGVESKLHQGLVASDKTDATSAVVDWTRDKRAVEEMEVDATSAPVTLAKEKDPGVNVSVDQGEITQIPHTPQMSIGSPTRDKAAGSSTDRGKESADATKNTSGNIAHEDQNNTMESLMNQEHSRSCEGETVQDRAEVQKTNLPLKPIVTQSDVGDSGQTFPPEQPDIGAESKKGGESSVKCDLTADVVDLTADEILEGKNAEEEMEADATATNTISELANKRVLDTNVSADQEETTQSWGSPTSMKTAAESTETEDHNVIVQEYLINLEHSDEMGSASDGEPAQEDKVAVQKPTLPLETKTKDCHSDFKKQGESWSKNDAPTVVIDLTIDEPDEPLSKFTVEPKWADPKGTRTVATPVSQGSNATNAAASSRKTWKVKKEATNQFESVWKRVNPQLFTNKIVAHCDITSYGTKLKDFLQLDLSHLLITNLPRGKPDIDLMNYLHKLFHIFTPPGWQPDFFFMMDVGVAIVALPPGRFAYDIVHGTTCRQYQGKKVRLNILNSNVASSPLRFFQAMMSIIDQSAVIDGSKTVFFGKSSEEGVAQLEKTFKNTQCVQYFMPLYGKLFIEFSTLEDADQFGFQLSRKNLPFGNEIYRLGLTPSDAAESFSKFSVDGADAHLFNASVPEGSHPPFWIPISSCPYLFPTARPSFIIPEHKTIRDMADVEVIVSKGDCGTFRTIMLTNLPQGYNAHSAIKRRVHPHFTNVTPLFDNYSIVILPLQRRAFVHFDDWESCSSCLQKLLQAPILVGKNTLCLHLVTQSMCPQYSEDTLYQSLMALSNTPVQNSNSLSERLLVVSVHAIVKNSISKLLDEVTSVGPFIHFLPLANRIYVEMVNSKDVFQLVVNYKKLSSTQKKKWRPINNFNSCLGIMRRLNRANEKHKKMLKRKGSGEARLPPSDCDMDPARSDVMVPECVQQAPLQDSESELDFDVKSGAVAIDEAQKSEVKSDAGSTDVADLKPSAETPGAQQASCPNMKQMLFTLKAAIRDHRLAKARRLATDESHQETTDVDEDLQFEGFVTVDEVSDCTVNQSDHGTSSFESRETRTDDTSSRARLSSRPTQVKTNQTSTEQLSDNQLQAGGVPAQSVDSNIDKQSAEKETSPLQGQDPTPAVHGAAPRSGDLTDSENRNESSNVDADKHSEGEDDDFEHFQILDEFEDQMVEEMDDANQDGRLETNSSEWRLEDVSNDKPYHDENDSFEVIDSINEDNAAQGQDSNSLIKEADSALKSKEHLGPDVLIEDTLSGTSWKAESCVVSEDVENRCGVTSTREHSGQDLAVIDDVHPEAFQILDSVDDQSANEDEPKDSPSLTQLTEDVEYEVIDCVGDQPTTTRERENDSNWDSTATMDQPNIPAAHTKEEPQKVVYEELYRIVDAVEGDAVHVSTSESSRRRSSRTRGKERSTPDQTDRSEEPDKYDETSLRVLDSVSEESTSITSRTRSSRSKRGSTLKNETSNKETETSQEERMATRRSRSLLQETTPSRKNTPTRTSSAYEILDSVEGDVEDESLTKGRRRRCSSQVKRDRRDATDESVAYQILDSVGEDVSRRTPSDENEFGYQILDSVGGGVRTDENVSDTSLEKSDKELWAVEANEEEGIYQILDSCEGEPPHTAESETTTKNEEAVKQEDGYRIMDCLEVAQEQHISPDSTKRAKTKTEENAPTHNMDSPRLKKSLEASLDTEKKCNTDTAMNDDAKRSECNTGPQEEEPCVNSPNVAATSALENLEEVSEEEQDSFYEALEEKFKANLTIFRHKMPIRKGKRKSVRSSAKDVVKRRHGKRQSQLEKNVVLDTRELVTVDEVTADESHDAKTGEVMEEDYLAMVTLDEITEDEGAAVEIFPASDELDGEEKEAVRTAETSQSMKRKHTDNKEGTGESDYMVLVKQQRPAVSLLDGEDIMNFVTVDEIHDDDNEPKKDLVALRRSRRGKRLQTAPAIRSTRRQKVNEAKEEKHVDDTAEDKEPQNIKLETRTTDAEAESKGIDGASLVESTLAHGDDQALERVLVKRKCESGRPAAKRSCGAADVELPAFTPNNPLGQEFVRPRSGFFCDLCSVFYLNESTAKEGHCSSQRHYDNLKNYYQKLQLTDSKTSRESSPLSTPHSNC